MGFWKNVENEIEFRGIARKELSAMSGVPMTTMNRAIERDSNPYAFDAVRIAKALELPLEELLGLPQSKQKNPPKESEKRQSDLYKKYRKLIDTLEMLPPEKRKLTLEIVERCARLGG